MMDHKKKGNIIRSVAIGVDTVPAFVATCTQFPVWVERSSAATMSGLFIMFAAISCIPFAKQIKEYMKSPAVWVLWSILFVLFYSVRTIVDEMIVVAFVGAVSNVVGAFVFNIGNSVYNKVVKEDIEDSEENEEQNEAKE